MDSTYEYILWFKINAELLSNSVGMMGELLTVHIHAHRETKDRLSGIAFRGGGVGMVVGIVYTTQGFNIQYHRYLSNSKFGNN